jgi:hypothetical protein
MENVRAVFEYLKESTWVQSLEEPVKLPEILLELYESTWADELYHYKRDIEEDLGIRFMTVKDMRNAYLTELLLKIDGVGYDIADKIASMV